LLSLDLPELSHPSIERFLRRCLQEAIAENLPRLPLYRSLVYNGILYRFPLQYHFSKTQQQEILLRFRVSSSEVSLSPDGWLEWLLGDRALTHWLTGLETSIERLFPDSPPCDGEFIFLFHYTYARCSSLLHLLPPPHSPLQPPYHPLERAVILQMLTLVDRAGTSNPRRQLVNFCEAILDLDRGCRIIGEPLAIARSRLGLFSLSQRLFRRFLVHEFAITPIEEF
jgi:hypothetical protein